MTVLDSSVTNRIKNIIIQKVPTFVQKIGVEKLSNHFICRKEICSNIGCHKTKQMVIVILHEYCKY